MSLTDIRRFVLVACELIHVVVMLNILGINVQKLVARGFAYRFIIICIGCNKLPATLWVFVHGPYGTVAFRPCVHLFLIVIQPLRLSAEVFRFRREIF